MMFDLVSEAKEGNLIVFQDEMLTFANHEVVEIPEVLWKLYASKTRRFDLSSNKLTSMKNLDKFTKLTELILDNNYIHDECNFPELPNLQLLSLNKNLLQDIGVFIPKFASRYSNLTFLSLIGNKACLNEMSSPEYDEHDYQRYRYFILYFLRKLKFLDSTKVTAEERQVASKTGLYSNIKRPKNELDLDVQVMGYEANDLIPQVPTMLAVRHRGAYLQAEYQFANKESEGNRFIRNQDL